MLLRVDKGRPKQANLRRAVSSPYYALFHFLIEESTRFVVGSGHANKPVRQLIGRGFTHTAIKEASYAMLRPTPRDLLKPFWSKLSILSCAPLQNVARIFTDLQEERHRADYDLSQPFTRQEAEQLLKRARSAVADWEILRKNHPEIAQFYAFCLHSWNNWKGR